MNLIICYTPLQVLIAEKIIARYPDKLFYGVMIYSVNNAKFCYYTERLKQKCVEFFSLHQHSNRFNLLKEILKIKWHFANKRFDHVFMASVNDIQLQFLLSSIEFNSLCTFDDGTANIVDSSILYQDEPNTWIRRLVNRVLRNRYNAKRIKALSMRHYTLYPNLPNIVSKTEPIELLDKKQNPIENTDVVNILLGQPIYSEAQQNIQIAEKVIQAFDIHYYLPHPREQYRLENVEYIETSLIFEDYIAQFYANKKCRIYTYFSSAALNVQYEHIEVIALKIDVSEPAYMACYALFEQLGIPVIDIRD